ncbi:tail assembly chaperone [Sporolactobacillus terrae]|uniref:tail assembly chaperone n=1 Tax=Sporolactobacillus terrae TaxID=269673 RepID=UPI000688F1C4|nr:tail assembly chaperone [Sporolactobacillus terrae]
MPTLNIKDKQIEAKIAFAFDRRANEKYTNPEQKGVTGMETIYQKLLDGDTNGLAEFWDCATAYLKKGQPTRDLIEEAIETVIDEERNADRLFKEAFKALDESGFFSKKLKNFWKNLNKAEEFADDEKELKQAKLMKDMVFKAREELLA